MSFKDSRRYKRIEVGEQHLNATLAIIENDLTTGCLVPVKDFSKSGAGVYVKFELKKHAEIRLSLEGADFEPLSGMVMWCATSKNDNHAPPTHPFRIGINFTPSDSAALENQLAVYEYIVSLVQAP